MTTSKYQKHATFELTDTIDQYSRKFHINALNGKVTIVQRWKDRNSDKNHTQRTTIDTATARAIALQLQVTANIIEQQ